MEATRYRVDGIVQGPAGPAEGVTVHLEVSDMRIRRQVGYLQSRTDTDGAFGFDLSEYDFQQLGLEFFTVSPRYVETMRIEIVEREDLPFSIELRVEPGTLARGAVRDSEGNPLGQVFISAPGVRTQQSDDEGDWEVFGVPPGVARLQFTKEGYATEFLTVRSSGPEVLEGLAVSMESSRQLVGRVLNWAGHPVPGALVTFSYRNNFKNALANDEGVVRFSGIPSLVEEGEATVLLQSEGYLPTLLPIDPGEVGERPTDWPIDSGVSLGGRVMLPDGMPAAGALIVAGEAGLSAPRVQSASDGSWRFGPFPPGEELLLTALPPHAEPTWGIADLVLQSAGTDGTCEGGVDLWPKGFSSIFTADFDGTSVRMTRQDKGQHGLGAQVLYRAEWDGVSSEIEGTLEVERMKQEGTFRLRRRAASAQGGLAGEWELREEIGPSRLQVAPVQMRVRLPIMTGLARLDFTLAEALELSGQVFTSEGRPFIDGTVMLQNWNGTDVFTPRVPIGAAGRFHFAAVPDGVFFLVAVNEDRTRSAGPLAVRGGLDHVELIEDDEGLDPMDD